MNESRNISEKFGRLADDFMLNIILLKKRDFQNESLPFLHAHVIELSSKAAIISLEGKVEGFDHRVKEMLTRLSALVAELEPLLPSKDSYARYRELYLADIGKSGNYVIANIPSPEIVEEWELCYYIDNIVNLKYGYSKDLKLVSVLSVATPTLNQRFKKMFKVLRGQYADPDSTRRLIERAIKIFGDKASNRSVLEDIFVARGA